MSDEAITMSAVCRKGQDPFEIHLHHLKKRDNTAHNFGNAEGNRRKTQRRFYGTKKFIKKLRDTRRPRGLQLEHQEPASEAGWR
jgi:hypothetical protein